MYSKMSEEEVCDYVYRGGDSNTYTTIFIFEPCSSISSKSLNKERNICFKQWLSRFLRISKKNRYPPNRKIYKAKI
jgi:hypothetical protein